MIYTVVQSLAFNRLLGSWAIKMQCALLRRAARPESLSPSQLALSSVQATLGGMGVNELTVAIKKQK